MPDYYTQFCTPISWPQEAAEFAIAVKNELGVLSNGSEESNQCRNGGKAAEIAKKLFEKHQEGCFSNFNYDTESELFTISADYLDDLDAVTDILQETMKEFNINIPVAIEWSESCSRLVHNGFSGGALVITPDKVHSLNTSDWAAEEIRRIVAEQWSKQEFAELIEAERKRIADVAQDKKPMLGIVYGDGGIQQIISDRPDEVNIGKIVVIDYDTDNDFDERTLLITQTDGDEERAYVKVFDRVEQSQINLKSIIDKLDRASKN
jgi:RNAse (barnase) inhibitor barstar